MSALLELIREAPPEDRRAAAEMLRPYIMDWHERVPETAAGTQVTNMDSVVLISQGRLGDQSQSRAWTCNQD